jgi:2-polyprenyl-3-methyl-5-hydroxy-6-metoxy-1,4-benzoquinol methylase
LIYPFISQRPCRICGKKNNPVNASEKPCALWDGRPWMPEGHYTTIRCTNCGNHYVDSDVSESYLDELQSSYILEHESKTTLESTEEGDRIRTAELLENWNMIQLIRRSNLNDKLLDFGSAWGAFGNIAKNRGVIPYGIELQPSAAEFSLRLWGGNSIIHRGPIETSPFSDNLFHYVTAFETLEHIFDPIKILKKMKRLVRNDGIIAISVPSAHYFTFKYWLYRKQPFNAWMRRSFPGNMEGGRVLIHNHLNTFSLKSAILMMEKAGLSVIHITPYCSGLSGGILGRVLKLVGRILWVISFKKIAFAPSIFIVAHKKVFS